MAMDVRPLARRTFLRAGSLSAFGLTLPDLLRARELRQQRIVTDGATYKPPMPQGACGPL